MSHTPQRKEKDCLNCGAIVQGKYCHNCGQENVVPHETFWYMVKHFLYDITHFDSKFFDSLRFLLFRPGFLPLEYNKGRRAAYLNPIKMYVFTSAIFFLIFFGFFVKKDSLKLDLGNEITNEDKIRLAAIIEKERAKDTASIKWKTASRLINDTTRKLTHEDVAPYWENEKLYTTFNGKAYYSLHEYDSVQKLLPSAEKDSWIQKIIYRRVLQVKEKYKNDERSVANKLRDAIFHRLPYLLFVSLPLFALILKLLYVRHKQLYYADHGIFTIYHYIFSFILLLVVFTIEKLNNLLNSGFIDFLMGALFLSGGFYLYKSMRKFYKQRRAKTILKFFLLNIAGMLMMILVFIIFLLFSVFEI